ncbi:hypothetical protein M3Y97_00102700 [Aphelenchoides bicaudatus]|nr:hypothetical protein M3Y97_00102700 [Aphelenchoides bicaudatus]
MFLELLNNCHSETSIFAWIMTAPLHHKTRVSYLKAINTLISCRCLQLMQLGFIVLNTRKYFTSEPLQDERIPFRTVFKDFDDSYNSLFYKTRFGFYYAYKGISDKFDWYLKVDDDTYLVAENLVKFLSTLNPNEPIYAGFRLKPYLKNGYNSGSVYALSRAAVKIFVDSLYNDSQKCPFDQYEDLGMGRCLSNAGIYPIQTRDRDDKGRFHIFDAFNTYTANNTPDQYEFYYKDTHKPGFEEFSKDLISLHHMQPRDIITADLFLYRVNIN